MPDPAEPPAIIPKPQQKQAKISSTVGSPPGPNRARTGLNALKARVKVRGLAAIDLRTAAARALLDWRRELLTDLGGDRHVSAAQRALIELAVRTRLYVDHVDAYLMEMSSLVTRRGRLKPIVEQRQRLVDSLARVLGQLGLERRAKNVTDLTAYVREKYATAGRPDTGAGVVVQPRGAADPSDTGAGGVGRSDAGASG